MRRTVGESAAGVMFTLFERVVYARDETSVERAYRSHMRAREARVEEYACVQALREPPLRL